MDARPTLFVGRISDVGPTYVVVGPTRIELRDDEVPARFHLGHSVSVVAVEVNGKFVRGSIVRTPTESPRAAHQSCAHRNPPRDAREMVVFARQPRHQLTTRLPASSSLREVGPSPTTFWHVGHSKSIRFPDRSRLRTFTRSLSILRQTSTLTTLQLPPVGPVW
jgi:hypothetical protein